MNKNIAIAVIGGLAAIGLVGAVYLLIERPDASATFTNLLVQILGLVVVAAGLGAGINNLTQEVKQVKTQTNGTLSKKDDEIAALRKQLADNGIHPDTEGNAP